MVAWKWRNIMAWKWRNVMAFWFIGVLNNSAYVIMNAGASEIAGGAVGLV
jgi:hypothetical protein